MWLSKYTDKLCLISGDKYVHVLSCMTVSFFVSKVLSLLLNKYVAAIIGFVVAVLTGVVKELFDDHFDRDDIKADIAGALYGFVFSLI